MNAIEVLLLGFDAAWKDQWESLTDACKDLTEEESVWQPPAYKKEPHDEGVGRPGTILWHLNHLEMCHRHYTMIIKTRPTTKQMDTKPPGELPLKKALVALEEATADLRKEVAKLKPEQVTEPARGNHNIADFTCMFTRHMAWHAAQIKQTRRLCAKRQASA